MLNLLRAAPFALLLLAGLAVLATRRRAASNSLIALFLGASCVAGMGQRDLWPFSAWPVMAESASRFRETFWYDTRTVDAQGLEHELAPSPLTRPTVEKWLVRNFDRLPVTERQSVASFLVMQNNERRLANERWLGPLTAPDALREHGPPPDRQVHILRIYRADLRGRSLVYEYTE